MTLRIGEIRVPRFQEQAPMSIISRPQALHQLHSPEMVLLSMTPAIVRAVQKCQMIAEEELSKLQLASEPSLSEPEAGKPISHSQLIDISKLLKKYADKEEAQNDGKDPSSYHLDHLLRGSKIYIPPPPPKKEPVRCASWPQKTMLSLYRHLSTKP